MFKQWVQGLTAAFQPPSKKRQRTPTHESARIALESAAIDYAKNAHVEFQSGVLYVSSARLRELGLIDSKVWDEVPSNDIVKVTRNQRGELSALALLVV
jgi:hypothetical protein